MVCFQYLPAVICSASLGILPRFLHTISSCEASNVSSLYITTHCCLRLHEIQRHLQLQDSRSAADIHRQQVQLRVSMTRTITVQQLLTRKHAHFAKPQTADQYSLTYLEWDISALKTKKKRKKNQQRKSNEKQTRPPNKRHDHLPSSKSSQVQVHQLHCKKAKWEICGNKYRRGGL